MLYESAATFSEPRISRDGKHIAFLEHPESGDDRGAVAVVDMDGKHKVLTTQFLSLQGLAWTLDGNIAFSGSPSGGILQINEVSLGGTVQPGLPGVGDAVIQDIGSDGRRLILRNDQFKRIWVKLASDSAPRDLSWLDVSFFPILSGDGSLLAFGDGSTVSGDNYAVMLRRTDGSPAVRIGDGGVLSMSRDKQWVISDLPTLPVQLMMYPTGAGTARRLDHGEFAGIVAASAINDGKDLLVCGNLPGHAMRCYVRPFENGTFRPFTPEGVRAAVASPDGRSVMALMPDGYREYSISDGSSRVVPGIAANELVLRYSPDGQSLWTRLANTQPTTVEQVDLKTGSHRVLVPAFSSRRAGVQTVAEIAVADDPRNYVYMERESRGYLFELKRGQK